MKTKWKPIETPEPLTPQWMLLKFLENWTSSDIELAIKKDIKINLKPIWMLIENIIIEELLSWFKNYRPDLYEVLSTEEGISWLKRNIREMIMK